MFQKIRSRVAQAVGMRSSAVPAWPLQAACEVPDMIDQLQSPLFGKLSAELRIPIYAVVLGDPERFLHICLNKPAKRRRQLAHWRCVDMHSPHPTWQHSCFGEIPLFSPQGNFTTLKPRLVTVTEDHLLGLFLSCRKMSVRVSVSLGLYTHCEA